MLRQLIPAEVSLFVGDDPVRPHLTTEFRTTSDRQVWGLFEDKYALYDEPSNSPLAIICVAFTNAIPVDEDELEWFSRDVGTWTLKSKNTAVFYTVWSYSRGAGKQIVNQLAQHILENRTEIEQWVTLSPLTDMAENFHTKNGALLHTRADTCQVFNYTHLLKGNDT